jgi:agmatinase
MSHHELFASQSNIFSGLQQPFDKADYILIGVPFDLTSTYRTGARFAPNAIRQASQNIETHSFRTGLDIENLKLHDLGDIHVSSDTNKTLETLSLVIKDINKQNKNLVSIGGEHTITLGILQGLKHITPKLAVVSFDAHLDLRNEYMDLTTSHTTYMRRLNEQVKPAKIIEVGTRAVCQEELTCAQQAGIEFFTTHMIREWGTAKAAKKLERELAKYPNLYISVDIDVIDPAYAPASQNPEPEGLDTQTLFDLLGKVCDKRTIGLDIVEVAPNYDQGTTAILAAKTIFEMLCSIEKSRKQQTI